MTFWKPQSQAFTTHLTSGMHTSTNELAWQRRLINSMSSLRQHLKVSYKWRFTRCSRDSLCLITAQSRSPECRANVVSNARPMWNNGWLAYSPDHFIRTRLRRTAQEDSVIWIANNSFMDVILKQSAWPWTIFSLGGLENSWSLAIYSKDNKRLLGNPMTP